jgi:uncharacterized protein (DUF362 family)
MDESKVPSQKWSRRSLLAASAAPILAFRAGGVGQPDRAIVSIVKVRKGDIDAAVEHAIDLLGGLQEITRGKDRILLKPNLVWPSAKATTNPAVIRALARLMKAAGKDVSIGEGSAAAAPFNVHGAEFFRTTKRDLLDGMQKYVFDQLGYAELARGLDLPLINLHTGDLVDRDLPGAFVFPRLILHRALVETDLLCSVPMMKTHTLAGVSLGMKNLIGAYPGSIYQAVRGRVHDAAARVEPSGTAAAIVDIVRANKLGLVVVDGTRAMEGNGPFDGTLLPMETIVAGTNPVATDMVAARLMGFDTCEVPVFAWANKAGMAPASLADIEVRGEPVERVQRRFVRPVIQPWEVVRKVWATQEI